MKKLVAVISTKVKSSELIHQEMLQAIEDQKKFEEENPMHTNHYSDSIQDVTEKHLGVGVIIAGTIQSEDDKISFAQHHKQKNKF